MEDSFKSTISDLLEYLYASGDLGELEKVMKDIDDIVYFSSYSGNLNSDMALLY